MTNAINIDFVGATCTPGDIRLQGGSSRGRVEICHNNIWGLVCERLWSNTSAIVACRQLGMPNDGIEVVLTLLI